MKEETTEQLIQRAKRYVEKLKPETTAEAKSYFRSFWDKYMKKHGSMPLIYYKNTRG